MSELQKVYVLTWSDYDGKPGVFSTLERALHHAAKYRKTDFKEIASGVWKSGTWYIDECAVIPDFESNPFRKERERDINHD